MKTTADCAANIRRGDISRPPRMLKHGGYFTDLKLFQLNNLVASRHRSVSLSVTGQKGWKGLKNIVVGENPVLLLLRVIEYSLRCSCLWKKLKLLSLGCFPFSNQKPTWLKSDGVRLHTRTTECKYQPQPRSQKPSL